MVVVVVVGVVVVSQALYPDRKRVREFKDSKVCLEGQLLETLGQFI